MRGGGGSSSYNQMQARLKCLADLKIARIMRVYRRGYSLVVKV